MKRSVILFRISFSFLASAFLGSSKNFLQDFAVCDNNCSDIFVFFSFFRNNIRIK